MIEGDEIIVRLSDLGLPSCTTSRLLIQSIHDDSSNTAKSLTRAIIRFLLHSSPFVLLLAPWSFSFSFFLLSGKGRGLHINGGRSMINQWVIHERSIRNETKRNISDECHGMKACAGYVSTYFERKLRIERETEGLENDECAPNFTSFLFLT